MLIKPEHGFDIEMKRGNQEILQFKTIKKKMRTVTWKSSGYVTWFLGLGVNVHLKNE